jgi:hypothetical protein
MSAPPFSREPECDYGAIGRHGRGQRRRGEGDTIPKPDGLEQPGAGLQIERETNKAGRCPALIELRSRLSLCHDLIDARPLDEAIEDDQEGLLVFVGELIDLLVKAVQFRVPNDGLGRSVGASGHLVQGDT